MIVASSLAACRDDYRVCLPSAIKLVQQLQPGYLVLSVFLSLGNAAHAVKNTCDLVNSIGKIQKYYVSYHYLLVIASCESMEY
jgi:hypothetical protein